MQVGSRGGGGGGGGGGGCEEGYDQRLGSVGYNTLNMPHL